MNNYSLKAYRTLNWSQITNFVNGSFIEQDLFIVYNDTHEMLVSYQN